MNKTTCVITALTVLATANIRVSDCLSAAEKGQRSQVFQGGRVRSVSCDLGREKGKGFTPDLVYCALAIEPVSLAEGVMNPPKSARLFVFTTVRTKMGIVASGGPSIGGAEISSPFVSFSVKSDNPFPDPLPPGRFELIVTVVVQADNGAPRLLDVHTSHFIVPNDIETQATE